LTTEEQIRQALEGILVPEVMRSLPKMNLVRKVAISGQKVNISLASTALGSDAQDWVRDKVSEVIKKLPEVNDVAIDFIEAKPAEVNDIQYMVAVMSGKGGVGKSLVAALLAVELTRRGKEVGILDADITGPSVPKMFGLSGIHPSGSETGILPVLSRSGIEIMSINLMLPHEDDAVIWRGPLMSKAITQFWEEVLWGKLDYIIVDLPPGTGDAPLTVMQVVPLSGVVIVFSPQELAAMVVRKAVKMTQKMNVPILGGVENMSYLILPDSGKKLEVFGQSKAEEMTKASGRPLLAQIPIDPQLAQLCDEGNIERYSSDILNTFGDNFLQSLSVTPKSDKNSQ
jgi:hydrogenase maturation protease